MGNETKSLLHQVYGWHWLVKAVADYTHSKVDEVYQMSLIELMSTSMIMKAREEYNSIK